MVETKIFQRIRSYAQNREDVVLARMFKTIGQGRYVEVGAYHPTVKSVSCCAYEHGWSGVLIEPQAEQADLLRRARPRDEVFQCAVSHRSITAAPFYNVPQATRSTLMKDIAEAYGDWKSTEVTVRTLNDILDEVSWSSGDIHFMSIDVEGFEAQALQGLDLRRYRPWVMVIEAIHPVTQKDSSAEWSHLLTENDYVPALFDGVSRFFVATEHADLLADCYPACSTDEFTLDYPLGAGIETLSQLPQLDAQIQRVAELLETTSRENGQDSTIPTLGCLSDDKVDEIEQLGLALQVAASRARAARLVTDRPITSSSSQPAGL